MELNSIPVELKIQKHAAWKLLLMLFSLNWGSLGQIAARNLRLISTRRASLHFLILLL
jgi:hypothetical protein